MNQNSASYRPPSLQQMGHLPGQAQQQVQPQAYSNPAGHGMRQPRMQPRYQATPTTYQPIYPFSPQLVTAQGFGFQHGANMSAPHVVTLPHTQPIISHQGAYYVPPNYQTIQVSRQPTAGAHTGGYTPYDGRQQPPQVAYSTNRGAAPHMNPQVPYTSVHTQHQHVPPMAPAQPQPQPQPQAPQHQQRDQQSQQQAIPVHSSSNQNQIQQQSQHGQPHSLPQQQHYPRVDGTVQPQRVHGGDQGQGGHAMGGPGGGVGKDTGTGRKKKILNIIDPTSGKNVFNETSKDTDTTAPDASKDDDKKVVSVAIEPPEVSAAGIANSTATTTAAAVSGTSSVASDPVSTSNINNVRESTPIHSGSTTDDSSSKTKVKSEFFNKISQANDDNKKPKSDETPVSKPSEEVADSPPAVVATPSPSTTSSSSNSVSVAATTVAPTTPPATTEAAPSTTSPIPSPPAAAAEELPAPTTALETPTPTPTVDDVKPEEVAPEVVEVPESTPAVIESTTSIDVIEKTVTIPEEEAKVDDEIAKINNNTIESEKVLTNGIEKLDEEDQENVPLSDSHELSTVSISPTPLDDYIRKDESTAEPADSTLSEEEDSEVPQPSVGVPDDADVKNEDAELMEDGEIVNDDKVEDGEVEANEDSESPKRILQYDRDSLMRIGRSNASKLKIDIQIADVVKDAKNNHVVGHRGGPGAQMSHPPNPSYGRNARNSSNSRNNMSGLGPIIHPNMMHRGGPGSWMGLGSPLAIPPSPPRGPGPGPRVIELQPKVMLNTSDNAWKPTRAAQSQKASKDEDSELTPDEKQTQNIVKQTRGILNKLTPENFDKLLKKFLQLELNDREDRISAVILVVFEKAIDEPSFSTAYARMVQHVCQNSQETAKKFRKEILDQCQKEFQKTNKDEDEIKAAELEIVNAPSDKKESLKVELEDKKFQMRRRSLGNVRFIGELYKLQMLTPKIMVDCVHMLLGSQDEESLECLCKLLTTVGEKLDNQLKEIEHRVKQAKADNRLPAPKFIPDVHFMDQTFSKLRKLSDESSKLSSRIRFALLDVVELREHGWKPRRDSNAPKTIDEVRREAARQEQEEKRQINALPDVNMGQRRPSPMNQSGPIQQKKGSDWNTVQSNKSSRFTQVKKPSELSNSPVLAPPVNLGWGGGNPPSRGPSSSNKSQLPPRFQQQQQQQQLQNQQGSGGQQHNVSSSRFGPSSQSGQTQPSFGSRFNALSNQSSAPGINLAPGGGGSTGGPLKLIPSTPQPTPPPPSQQLQQQPRDEPYNSADLNETVKNIFEEFVSVKKFEDTMHWIKGRFPGDKVLDFVDTLARMVGEMSKEAQQCGAGQLIKMLIKHRVIQRDEVLDSISRGVIQDIPDIEVDCPKVTSYVAMFVLEIFMDESNLNWLIELSQPLKEEFEETWSELIGATLNLFKYKRDEPYVKSLWSSTKDKDALLSESLPWLSDESVPSLVNKMIPVLEKNEREEIINIFKERSWDQREPDVSSALLLAICEVSYVGGKWEISKLDKCLPLLSKPQGPDLWKIVKDQFLLKKGVGKDQEDLLWTRLLNSKLVDQ